MPGPTSRGQFANTTCTLSWVVQPRSRMSPPNTSPNAAGLRRSSYGWESVVVLRRRTRRRFTGGGPELTDAAIFRANSSPVGSWSRAVSSVSSAIGMHLTSRDAETSTGQGFGHILGDRSGDEHLLGVDDAGGQT